jgi:hypothetical protein
MNDMRERPPVIIAGLESQVHLTRQRIRLQSAAAGAWLLPGLIAALDALDPAAIAQPRKFELIFAFFCIGAVAGLLAGELSHGLLHDGILRYVQRRIVDELLLPHLLDEQFPMLEARALRLSELQATEGTRRHKLASRFNSIAQHWPQIAAQLGRRSRPAVMLMLQWLSLPVCLLMLVLAYQLRSFLVMFVPLALLYMWWALQSLQGNAVRQVLLEVLRAGGSEKYHGGETR